MLIAIDTSTEWIGLALYDGVQILSEQSWRSKNFHTAELAPSVATMLQRANVHPKDVTGIGVALGPGSFTGMRIGVALAKGLALAFNVPLVGIPSLDILAHGQPLMRRPMICLLKVGRGRFAWARYESIKGKWVRKTEISVDEPKAIAKTITSPIFVCGEMGAEERQTLGRKWKTAKLAEASQSVRRPAILAELAGAKLKAGQREDIPSLSPIYVHTLSNIPEV
ncbi:MAG: tRNA (adenosine(37)-N6)-threonylcarbamoyltransferase complex dimerization subunit type 1 TsaB [Anaerolineaceae bacterium]|nr:tRNA (adenosine(37)-N6)-threonylcarbamoyltransferase complex dimerization subunit type 1 TsaB [Anaerolineaceae bacterium]